MASPLVRLRAVARRCPPSSSLRSPFFSRFYSSSLKEEKPGSSNSSSSTGSSGSERLRAFTNAFVDEPSPDAEQEEEKQRGGPLDGWRVAIKANFCTADALRTTCASRMLESFYAPYDATVVSRWRRAGAAVVGKTNMDEFAMGSSSVHTPAGPVLNPWTPVDAARAARRGETTPSPLVAGGSSGGSAAAVAARLCDGALGSDTGGSVRQPAAFCGVAGFKPTYGRLSRHGLVAFASSLDTPGVFARTVEQCRTLFAAADGVDEMDSTSCGPEDAGNRRGETGGEGVKTGVPADGQPLAGLRIGVPAEYFVEELDPLILQAWKDAIEIFRAKGADVVSVSLPNTPHALPAYYVIAPCEAASNLARYDGVEFGSRGRTTDPNSGFSGGLEEMMTATRGEMFGAEVQRRILLGTFCLSKNNVDSFYLQALRVRRMILEDFQRVFDSGGDASSGVDFLLTPTTSGLPPTLEEAMAIGNPVEEYISDVMTAPASLAGLPAISVPRLAHKTNNGEEPVPVGLQLIGRHHSDYELLEAACQLQDERLTTDDANGVVLPPTLRPGTF
jgi:aspartyl-tRNA(Asn)/glutamyl-tRNA(Gln) amidotransferase subunit A